MFTNIKTASDLQAEADAIALEQSVQQAIADRKQAMMTGFVYNGYSISVTSEDGNGMLQVKAAFEMGLPSTNIHFENKTTLPMLAINFPAFALQFVTERDKFFV